MNMEKLRETTAEQFAALAEKFDGAEKASLQAKEDSFQRSDTDGFLSQWASGISANVDRMKADICRNQGKWQFTGLYEGDRRVMAKQFTRKFNGHYSTGWVMREDELELIGKRGKPFLPSGDTSRVLRGLGLRERAETDWAWAGINGQGTGLSGTAWAATYRAGDKWGGTAEVIKDE